MIFVNAGVLKGDLLYIAQAWLSKVPIISYPVL